MDYDHKLHMEKNEWMSHFCIRLIALGVAEKVAKEDAEFQWIHSPNGSNPIDYADLVASRYGLTDHTA